MASKLIAWIGGAANTYDNYALYLDYSESTDTANNTSTYSYTLRIYKKGTGGFNYGRGNTVGLSFGSQVIFNGDIGGINLSGIPQGGSYNLLSGTTSAIAHNSDGSGSINIWAKFYQTQTGTTGWWHAEETFTVTMTPIARASKPTASNVVIGNAVTIETHRGSDSFTHTLQYKLGSMSSYANLATNVATSYSWTVPYSIIQYISNAASATVTINCITYNGSTVVGSNTTTFKATIPGSGLSFSSNAAITMGTAKNVNITNPASSYLTVSATWSYGAKSSQALTTSFGTYNYSWPVATFAPCIPSSTTGTVTVTAVTSRGTATVNTTSKTFTLNLPDNTNPVINAINITDSKGYLTRFGSFISGKSKLNWTINASAGVGTSINYWNLYIGSIGTYSTQTGSVDIPSSVSGTKAVTAKVRDQRYTGNSEGSEEATLSSSIVVTRYSAPTISGTAVRCDSAGNEEPASGTYIKISGRVTFTSITGGTEGSNTITLTRRIRRQNGTWSSSTAITLTNNEFSVIIGTYSYENGWEVELTAADKITTAGTKVVYTVPSAVFPIDVYPSQTSGIAFGTIAKENQLYSAWEIGNPQGHYVWATPSSGDTSGYFRLCDITITNTYFSSPIIIDYCSRRSTGKTRITLTFDGSNSTDPALSSFTYFGEHTGNYVVKTSSSNWSIYVSVSTYNYIFVTDYCRTVYGDARHTLQWSGLFVSSLPTGSVEATAADIYATNIIGRNIRAESTVTAVNVNASGTVTADTLSATTLSVPGVTSMSTSTLTYGTGLSASTDVYTGVRKRNRLVSVNFSVGPSSATNYSAGWLTLLTIPDDGNRPGSSIGYICGLFGANDVFKRICRGQLGSNGQCRVHIDASVTAVTRFTGSFCYYA